MQPGSQQYIYRKDATQYLNEDRDDKDEDKDLNASHNKSIL